MTTRKQKPNSSCGKKRKGGPNKGKLVSFPATHKWRGIYYNYDTVASGWSIFQSLGFDQGLDYHERIGNSVCLDSIEWDLNFRPSVTDGNDAFRWALVKCNNPVITNASLPVTSEPINPFLFTVLHEERITCTSVKTSSTAPLEGSGLYQKRTVGKLSLNIVTLFSGPGDTDISMNKVVFAVDSDSDATPHPTIHGWLRVYFHSLTT